MSEKTRNLWTEEEFNILREHGLKLSRSELAKLLPRHTPAAISKKRQLIGLWYPASGGYYQLDQEFTLTDLNNDTLQLLLGSMMGDGSVHTQSKRTKNFMFSEKHKLAHAAYVEWKSGMLSLFQSRYNVVGDIPQFYTASHPIFKRFREWFYPKLTKSYKQIIPEIVEDQLDLFGLMIWYLDDGTRGSSNLGKLSICVMGWKLDHIIRLCERLNHRFGLSLRVKEYPHIEGRMNKVLVIPSKDRDYLLPIWQELAETHNLPECMRYKIKSGTKLIGKSGHVGIHQNYGRWQARITYDGREEYIGTFGSIEEAVSMRQAVIEGLR